MATQSRSKTSQPAAKRAATIEAVRLLAPTERQAQSISECFGLNPVDGEGVKTLHYDLLVETADALKDHLNERAMQIHMQRTVGSFVASALGASQFYSRTITDARDATSSLANDHRDEDRDGPAGFESYGQRKREFAAEVALQAYTLAMAAEGAIAAYDYIVGETWKPYERQSAEPGQRLARDAGKRQLDAFS